MKLNVKDGVHYYTFDSFEKTGLVRHCFSTRIGGVSKGCYSGMNLGFSRGDNRENVCENYRRLAAAAGFDEHDMVMSSQCHGVRLYRAEAKDRGKGIFRENDIRETDGLVTDQKNVVLTTFSADCVLLYFLDPVKKVIALSHAGWRGTVQGMARLTVEEMQKYGCRPNDILAGIGPSIGGCCFEVDNPVAEAFEAAFSYAGLFISRREDAPQKYFIDLWRANAEILVRAGVLEKNIETGGLCTMCNPDIFYSHRLMGNERGSMVAVMELV